MLRCTITAWPIPLVTWLRNGGSLRSSHKVRNITNNKEIVSEVEISKAEKADIGTYSCIAENMFDRRSIDISLAVLSKQKFLLIASSSIIWLIYHMQVDFYK